MKKYLCDVQQFDVKYEGGAGWYDRPHAVLAVRHVGRDGQLAHLAHAHALHTLVPSLDDLSHPQGEVEGLVPVSARVELFAVRLEEAGIVHAKLVPNFGLPDAPAQNSWVLYSIQFGA